jgi:hypothetical protein
MNDDFVLWSARKRLSLLSFTPGFTVKNNTPGSKDSFPAFFTTPKKKLN